MGPRQSGRRPRRPTNGQEVKLPLLTLMTVATHSERGVLRFLESCKRVGIRPVVLGRRRRWRGFGRKFSLLRDARRPLRRLSQVILFADACDSLVLDGDGRGMLRTGGMSCRREKCRMR